MFATARGACGNRTTPGVGTDPYSGGHIARESFRCRELAREADVRPCILSIAKYFIIRRKLCPKF